jgi:hypothetical protein
MGNRTLQTKPRILHSTYLIISNSTVNQTMAKYKAQHVTPRGKLQIRTTFWMENVKEIGHWEE